MFQALPVRSTSCRRRRRRSAMSTICINRAAAAGPLGHDEPRFRAFRDAQRSQVSLGDGWSVCECRGSLSARGYLPVFSSLALLISAAERRSAKKRLPQRRSRTQGCSGRQLGHACCFGRAVAPVNPTLVLLIISTPPSRKLGGSSSSRRDDSSGMSAEAGESGSPAVR
jgi:hypothetical protein